MEVPYGAVGTVNYHPSRADFRPPGGHSVKPASDHGAIALSNLGEIATVLFYLLVSRTKHPPPPRNAGRWSAGKALSHACHHSPAVGRKAPQGILRGLS
jgi:hypothetical protein